MILNRKGITLIELLVALVIGGFVIAGIYRLFVAQTKAYTIQDQIVEVQQNVRSAMERLLRDLRMTGYDNDHPDSKVAVATPLVVGNNSVTTSFELNNTTLWTIAYARDVANSRLTIQVTETRDDGTVTNLTPAPEDQILLDNVDAFNLTYGVDQDNNGAMDDRNANGVIDDNDWVSAATVTGGNLKVVAIRVILTARPTQVNPDMEMVSQRTLRSAVTLRNLCLR